MSSIFLSGIFTRQSKNVEKLSYKRAINVAAVIGKKPPID